MRVTNGNSRICQAQSPAAHRPPPPGRTDEEGPGHPPRPLTFLRLPLRGRQARSSALCFSKNV